MHEVTLTKRKASDTLSIDYETLSKMKKNSAALKLFTGFAVCEAILKTRQTNDTLSLDYEALSNIRVDSAAFKVFTGFAV